MYGHHYLDKMFTNRHMERKILKKGKLLFLIVRLHLPLLETDGPRVWGWHQTFHSTRL